jgi:outer membrane protein assembly factor BamA
MYISLDLSAQKPLKDSIIIIQKIIFEGNKITKERIIRRELDFKEGDTLLLKNIDTTLKRNQIKVFNTRLFVTAHILLDSTQKSAIQRDIHIKLHERWYIFPIPLFELSDRNFNEWWTTYNRDLRRVNYGLNVIWDNFRGRKEKLNFLIQGGFTERISLQYSIPYLDKKQNWGLTLGASFSQNKSIAFQTLNHKLDFIRSRNVLRERTRLGIGIIHRKGFYTFQNFDFQWNNHKIADTIAFLNPNYFKDGKTFQQYFSLGYSFRYDLRDVQAYPLRGQIFYFNISKHGLGLGNDLNMVNQTNFSVVYGHYRPIQRRWYREHIFAVFQSFQDFQPYAFASAFGYGDNTMRGYELFVIDGQGSYVNRNTLKFQLYDGVKKINFIKARQFNRLPLGLYWALFADFGYVEDKRFTQFNNTLNNRFLYGYGTGIDIFTSHNLVLRFSYAFNRLGTGAFYFNFNADL